MPRRRRRVPIEVYAARLRERPTEAELSMKAVLQKGRLMDRFLFQVPVIGYIPDFHDPKLQLIIEVDGYHHATKAGFQRDMRRTAALGKRGFKVIRFWNKDVLGDPAGVLADILAAIQSLGGKKTRAERARERQRTQKRAREAKVKMRLGQI